ncbi:MAG: hypothetical protein JW993_13340 [Sedimentisphaerales bacterium]|nr:hypothetical protein [Sedimentisphaerales bacterium]
MAALLAPHRAAAIDLWSDEDSRSGTLSIAGKATSLVSDAPADPFLFPDGLSRTTLTRLRLGLEVRHNDWMDSELAYEQRARWVSGGAGFGAVGSVLPSEAAAPYRVTQLDWPLDGEDRFAYRHEIDRASVSLHPEWGDVTIGRQAIGLGRGVLFGAVDVFNPFSPLEVDREWRRGVDAFRAEYRLSTTTSAEAIAVFGESWDQSALLGRFRGYLGEIDGSLIVGKRAEDFMVGGTFSAIVGEAEVHGELATFHTPGAQPDGTLWGSDRLATKAVLGGSYTFDVGNGLMVIGEYHYSDFGIKDIANALVRLQDPDFQRRLLRGDTQILGRQALATQLSYPFDDSVSGSFLVLTNPTDGSGVLSPSLRLDLDRNTSFIASAFIPWGAAPFFTQLRSEYGASSASLFLQAAVYY